MSKVKIRETSASKLWKVFANDPLVKRFDKIFLVQLGGAGGFGRVVKAAMERYPYLRNKMEVLVVDFDLDDRYIDRQWGIFDLGADGVDGRNLEEVVAEFGVPPKYFTRKETAAIESFVEENGTHQFVWGAGNNPLIGKLGFIYSQEAFKEFLYEYFKKLAERVTMENVLVLIVSGTGGGTGYGIVEEATPLITNLAREMGVNGAAGVIPVFLGWRAYTPIIYSGTGEQTALAPLMWSRSQKAWDEQRNSFFVASQMGPDSLLALIQLVLEKARVLNNAHEQGGYKNYIMQFDEITKWSLMRFAGFEISRGHAPQTSRKIWKVGGLINKSIELLVDVEGCNTVADYANAMHLLREDVWAPALSQLLRERRLEPRDIRNYGQRHDLIAAQLHMLNAIVQQLTRMSGSTGLYLMSDELDIVANVHPMRLSDIQRGTAQLYLERDVLEHLVPPGVAVISRDKLMFGASTALGELGTNNGKGKDKDVLAPLSFRSISREEQHALDMGVTLEKVNARVERTRSARKTKKEEKE